MKTLVVNLFGGPGTGKSTNAALIFGKLKTRGVEAELVHEYAKDLVWEGRHRIFEEAQQYIAAKQQWHVERCFGQVEVVVTDSPLLFPLIYGNLTNGLSDHIRETFNGWRTYNVFLRRNSTIHPYVERGRNQTEDEAKQIDQKIYEMLLFYGITADDVPIMDNDETAEHVAGRVIAILDKERQVR